MYVPAGTYDGGTIIIPAGVTIFGDGPESWVRAGFRFNSNCTYRDLRIGDDRIRVTTSPVQSIAMVSAPTIGARAFGRRGQDLTRAEFPLPAARYCRIQAMTRDGKTAWSHPVLLVGPP